MRAAVPGDSGEISRLLEQLGYQRDSRSIESDLRAGSVGHVVVATVDGRVVGLLAMLIHRQLHQGAEVASIEALVVDEHARSGGIGSALLNAAVERARGGGCALVELHSNQERHAARRFYEQHGFRVTSSYFVLELT